jgi:pyruvate, water dikinase
VSVVWVDEIDPLTDAELVGAKISRLAELRAAGISVPRGFVVATSAFRRFCDEPGLAEVLTGLNDAADADAQSALVRERMDATEVPFDIAGAIAEAYDDLSARCLDVNVPVAVRSSATGEDAADASFAGQFDTYLGITGGDEVVDAVRRCWSSLFTARAIGYRRAKGRSQLDSPMAVGVLELIHAQVSGVAFSIHPVTGNPERIVIEGSWGWGEAVVQGLVTPDHLEVDKADGRLLTRAVAHKRVVSTFDYRRGGVVEIPMPARLQDAPILDDEQLAAVVDAVCRIESHYAYPVDVEWVLDRSRRPGDPVTIVQVRPESVHGGEVAAASPRWDVVAAATKYVFGGPP